MTPSCRIRAKLELGQFALRSVSANLLSSIGSPADLADYLVMLHWMTRASIPLMVAARRACDESSLRTYHDQLSGYLDEQILEEQEHDVWLLKDIEAAGLNQADALGRPPSTAIASLVGAQYYWIYHHDPIAIIGYIAVMENEAPTHEQVDILESRFGPRCIRTMREHASLDSHHCARLDALLDTIPLTRETESVIVCSGLHTIQRGAEAVSAFLAERQIAGLESVV